MKQISSKVNFQYSCCEYIMRMNRSAKIKYSFYLQPDAKRLANYGLVHPYNKGNYSMSDLDSNTSYENIHPDSKTIPEGTGFTQINNNVINNIKDGDAFLVWCYLYSKTSNWKTIKENIKNVYGYGDIKLRKIFSYLNRCKLIEYVQPKNKDGTFQPSKIRILNGLKFDKNEPFCTTPPVGQETAPAVNRTDGFEGLRNKENTKERKERNKPPKPPTGEGVRFEEFWNLYPVKNGRKACEQKWKKRNLDDIADKIIEKLTVQVEEDDKWLRGFAPNPLTYINQDRWEDEIAQAPKTKPSKGDAFNKYLNSQSKGETYDQHGNTYDPFR